MSTLRQEWPVRPRRSHGASHAGDGLRDSGYPNTCAACGERVKVTGDEALWFMWTAAGGKRSYHARCFPTHTREATAVAVAGSGGKP